MQSRWSDDECRAAVARYGARGASADLAIRTYTTRLLGSDPELVLHGGGNTSVKTRVPDVLEGSVAVICVKGSGWDMATIEPAGLPAVRLDPLRRLADLDRLSDDDMVLMQRRMLMDPAAPNPSVEAVLHAIVPGAHVDHTHANAVVALTNQPQGGDRARELFPDAVHIPYVMPGFDLAQACRTALATQPRGQGMILWNHGIFTWSDDPRDSYEAMIAMVDAAERRLARGNPRPFRAAALPAAVATAADVAPILRGAVALPGPVEGRPRRFVLAHRADERILAFCNAGNAAELASRGNATPDHVLRIKRTGVALPAPEPARLDAFAALARERAAAYAADYEAYFARNDARVGGGRRMVDPSPRVFYVAGVGLFAAGPTAKEAGAAADVAAATIDVIARAEGMGGFRALPEADIFDLEYWSLEQAKMQALVERPLTRQVAAVTGGASGLGLAIARALRAEGAEVAILDRDGGALAEAARGLGGLGLGCDVTDAASVDAAMDRIAAHFGGVDILVSNAGAAVSGGLLDLSDAAFRASHDLNFWGHHHAARAAVRVMRAQGTGGALVFNVSKQAVNPGPDFGAYGTAKAALLSLVRQYAVEFGGDGITANAVHPDRIRTGLMTDAMVEERSRARGVTPHDYMRGNLLRREVTAEDVAQAVVHLAQARASTGAVLTVDGGNVAAMMR